MLGANGTRKKNYVSMLVKQHCEALDEETIRIVTKPGPSRIVRPIITPFQQVSTQHTVRLKPFILNCIPCLDATI